MYNCHLFPVEMNLFALFQLKQAKLLCFICTSMECLGQWAMLLHQSNIVCLKPNNTRYTQQWQSYILTCVAQEKGKTLIAEVAHWRLSESSKNSCSFSCSSTSHYLYLTYLIHSTGLRITRFSWLSKPAKIYYLSPPTFPPM